MTATPAWTIAAVLSLDSPQPVTFASAGSTGAWRESRLSSPLVQTPHVQHDVARGAAVVDSLHADRLAAECLRERADLVDDVLAVEVLRRRDDEEQAGGQVERRHGFGPQYGQRPSAHRMQRTRGSQPHVRQRSRVIRAPARPRARARRTRLRGPPRPPRARTPATRATWSSCR